MRLAAPLALAVVLAACAPAPPVYVPPPVVVVVPPKPNVIGGGVEATVKYLQKKCDTLWAPARRRWAVRLASAFSDKVHALVEDGDAFCADVAAHTSGDPVADSRWLGDVVGALLGEATKGNYRVDSLSERSRINSLDGVSHVAQDDFDLPAFRDVPGRRGCAQVS